MNSITEQIIETAYYCGKILINADRTKLKVDEKEGQANFVTDYDRRIEEILRDKLSETVENAAFIGEEGEYGSFEKEGYVYIVDPIDGTTNFIKDYHASCISIALLKEGEPYIGVIYNPYLDEMFYAERGNGAFCNNEPIHVSNHSLSEGIVLFGSSPYNEELNKKSFEIAYDLFQKSLDIRRSGSAALDLCSVAAGRAELYFELILSPWDYAAGTLIVREAGGTVTDCDGNKVVYDRKCSILARGNGKQMPCSLN